jgi:Protein tyrosine and serine/threonine kinase
LLPTDDVNCIAVGVVNRRSAVHRTELDDNTNPMSVILKALEAIAGNSDIFSSEQLVAGIENISADEIKRRVLELVSGRKPEAENGSVQQHTKDTLRTISEATSLSVSSDVLTFTGTSVGENLHNGTDRSRHKQLNRVPSKEWEISIYEIKFTKRLGQGASATTYLGQWTGQNVAIKVASITEFGQDGWRTEVNALQRLHHPNIIRMMGTIYNENPQTQCLVLEYCNAGDLATALRYPTPKNFFFHVSTSIANAMTYLHSR